MVVVKTNLHKYSICTCGGPVTGILVLKKLVLGPIFSAKILVLGPIFSEKIGPTLKILVPYIS